MRKLLLCCLALSSVAAVARAAGPAPAGGTPPSFRGHAVFCTGQYALCIKANCPTPKGLPAPGQTIDCECDILNGCSMGPDSCEDRAKSLVSTYSNAYNNPTTNKTLFCQSGATIWAWCYGAPCKPDPKNPGKAICSCPVEQGPAMTLGGKCEVSACSQVWSAATPAEDAFANHHFYKAGQKECTTPPNPPALPCASATAKPAATGNR